MVSLLGVGCRDSDGRLCGEEQDGWTRECPELDKEQKTWR